VRWLAVDEVAAWAGRDEAAVYRLAYRHKWRRYRHGGKTFYHPGDAEHTIKGLTRVEGVGDP
jgi:hypothetical protein